ncbi:hypothetical protein BDDG_05080 [Blastomyces dermatitidis ATCC 18188]|uniref:Uncharacterized protein n=1 Tax=Ajellomyces dermatitidis (strain ATCC 18188 / CBS 674.68) TaxID=653446 RepID=F2TFX4_AJEDA|nr:hypothetical protein BDDG_05080 [Blastomyces dermatitidis ATCC 18188]
MPKHNLKNICRIGYHRRRVKGASSDAITIRDVLKAECQGPPCQICMRGILRAESLPPSRTNLERQPYHTGHTCSYRPPHCILSCACVDALNSTLIIILNGNGPCPLFRL